MKQLLRRIFFRLTDRIYEQGWQDGLVIGYQLSRQDHTQEIIDDLMRDAVLATNLDVYLFERVIDIIEDREVDNA